MTTLKPIAKKSKFALALAALAACMFLPEKVAAQWTTPDASQNINNTNSNNVGVGTTVPLYKLEVANMVDKAQIRFGLGAIDSGGFLFSNAPSHAVFSGGASWNGGWVAKSMSASLFQANNGAVTIFGNTGLTPGNFFTPTARMTINPSGNVGIGTTTPSYPLTVNQTGDSVNRLVSLANDSSGSSAQSTISFFEGATEKFKFGMNSSGATGYVGGANAFQVWHFQNAPIVFGTNSVERMRINGAGNIGVGTTSPQTRFDIKQSSDTFVGGLHLRRSSTNDTWALVTGADNSLYMGYANNASGADAQGDFTVYPLVLTSAGNVGIGTTAPASKLEVAGTIHSTSGGIKFPDGSVQTTAGGGGGSVSSVFGRTGAVVAATNDYTWAQINKSAANAGDLATGTLLAARMPALTGDVTTSVGTVATTLSNTGVSAGSYTNANITVDAKGRVTAASNGTGGSTAFSNITAGTNTVALVVGTGGSLGVSGTGNITATSLTTADNITSGTVPITRLGTGTPDSTKFLRGDNAWTAITSSQWANGSGNINYTTGNVGIGTTNPSQKLEVYNASGPTYFKATSGSAGTYLGTDGTNSYIQAVSANQKIFLAKSDASPLLTADSGTGNVGIGTTSPSKKLHVAGDIQVDGNINAKYQDLAEWVPSSEQLSTGTVVVLDTTKSNQVISSTASYDTRVAGVISTQPGITLGESGVGKVLVATTGRVRVKVDATRGPIQIGDLLVTSDISGVAMKSEPVEFAGRKMHMPGTIIGKALEPLAKGSGEILVLLSLQ